MNINRSSNKEAVAKGCLNCTIKEHLYDDYSFFTACLLMAFSNFHHFPLLLCAVVYVFFKDWMIDEEHMYNERRNIYFIVWLHWNNIHFLLLHIFLAHFTVKPLTFKELNPEIILYCTICNNVKGRVMVVRRHGRKSRMIVLIPYIVKHAPLRIVSTRTSRSTHVSISILKLILIQRKQWEGVYYSTRK